MSFLQYADGKNDLESISYLRESRQETDGIQFLAARKNKEMIFVAMIN